jgi:hypothetical protein
MLSLFAEVARIEGRESKVRENRLERNMNETEGSPENIRWVLALINHMVLDELEKLHEREPQKTGGNPEAAPSLDVPDICTGENP